MDKSIFVVGVWTLDGAYAITGVFDNEVAAVEAADTIEAKYRNYFRGDVLIDAYPLNDLLTPGPDVITKEQMEAE